ncbi:MAG: alpha/beta hydrolase [Pedobacter sp.]|jgi:acetyl esterase/lipase
MLRFTKLFAGILFLLIVSAGCKKGEAVIVLEPLAVAEYQNVAYGSNLRHVLDMYLPAARDANTPVVLLLHGGSWYEGDKGSLTELAKHFRDKGYAAATMNYRLTNTAENNIHPAQVNDIGKAIEFISSKSAEWKISADKFALQGASAGAHLSLLYTYKFNANNKVKAVISMAGPTDLSADQSASPAQIQVLSWFLGTSIQADPALYADASPLTHVSVKAKPTLIFHGKLDIVVPYQQAELLKNKLDQYGIANKLVLYGDTGHELLNLSNKDQFLSDCENWLKLYLK